MDYMNQGTHRDANLQTQLINVSHLTDTAQHDINQFLATPAMPLFEQDPHPKPLHVPRRTQSQQGPTPPQPPSGLYQHHIDGTNRLIHNTQTFDREAVRRIADSVQPIDTTGIEEPVSNIKWWWVLGIVFMLWIMVIGTFAVYTYVSTYHCAAHTEHTSQLTDLISNIGNRVFNFIGGIL